MLSAVQANNYDGITVDFEGISPEDGQYLTLFMRELYGNMKAMNKLVAMAVPAKTRDINTGWAGAFTYRDLAPWTDFMILMAYDQHFPGGQPGPIAPIGWMGMYSATPSRGWTRRNSSSASACTAMTGTSPPTPRPTRAPGPKCKPWPPPLAGSSAGPP